MYANGPKIPTDQLVLCLDAGNVKSYPASGTVWTDISRNNNNATLSTGISFDSGSLGSLRFRGADSLDSATIPASNFNVDNRAPNCSVCGWFNAQTSTDLQYIAGFRNDTNFDFYVLLNTNASNTEIRLRTNSATATLNPTFPNNRWNFFALTANSASFNVYINENLAASAGIAGNFGSAGASNFRIGRDTAGRELNGYLSSLLLYRKPLSAQEVLQCYNAYKGRYKL